MSEYVRGLSHFDPSMLNPIVKGRVIIPNGNIVELIDGCDRQGATHRDGTPHDTCVTSRYKVRILEKDEDSLYYWARPAG